MLKVVEIVFHLIQECYIYKPFHFISSSIKLLALLYRGYLPGLDYNEAVNMNHFNLSPKHRFVTSKRNRNAKGF